MDHMNVQRRRAVLRAGAALPFTMPFARAQAQAGGPLRIVVPVGAGSGADGSTRFLAERLGRLLGQAVIVENRPGADYLLGVQALLDAPADGRTLMMLSPTPMVMNPIFRKYLAYVPLRDIRPLVGSVGAPPVLVTGASSRHGSLAAMLAVAHKTPRSVTMAYYGHQYRVASLLMEDLQPGLQFNYVPYKAPSQVLADLVGGAVDLAFVDPGAALSMVTSGKLRALATTGRSRNPVYPDLPTLDESGFKGYELFVWIGYGVHGRTPEPQAQALQAALTQLIGQQDFRTFTQQAGQQVLNWPGPELAARIASDTERWRPLLEQAERAGR